MNADLMSTIEGIQNQTTVNAILDIMNRAISNYGFERFIVSGLPDPGMDVRPFVLLSGWKEEWYERYTGLGYVHLDPVARHCFSTAVPFDWSQAPYDQENDKAARQVMEEAREFGMGEGFCVPVHMEGGMQGVVSLVGSPGHLDEKQRFELHMLSLYAHGRLRYLNGPAGRPRGRRVITPREAEILKWAAAGKTASEIAEITGLTPRTINQHCENAQKRMGTSNRLHTVVEAIRHKLITL
ncbi:LuxR family quorum sensing-dependent transcriptional regulator [Devosia subaequoris]|uniref:LuxR family quorum sensing-dependent transcriptional regulator n=1 Tax=Devosia subaequoris TaxID=395930 RepID=A0A7W6IPD7_9HYPH|nr:LuxR family transcriptional regulator [Devosia subaequoris]MBB4052882.1 LuxR family quorum sensing-dependent transcriptional regulator [Devosia subaequoris]MCP1210301.1 LuxR family transcriptional regulator [Devosia subaequoris]